VPALGIYLVCRAVTLGSILLASSPVPVAHRIDAYDAGFYAQIAASGYPHALTPVIDTPISFFPGYPLVVRALADVGHLPIWGAQLVISLVAGAVATLLIARVVSVATNADTGWSTAISWQLLPQAYLLCLGYSEGLFTAFAALALLFALRRRWVWAGGAAAVSSFIHPTGLVFVLVGAVALVQAYRSRRSLAPWPFLALAPVGALAYFAYLDRHTGHPSAWLTAEQNHLGTATGAHVDFGVSAAKFVGKSVLEPTAHPWFDLVTLTMGLAVVLLIIGIRMRLPVPMLVYSGGIVVVGLMSGIGTLGSFPRMAFTAFPLMIPVGSAALRLPRPVRWAIGAVGLGLACVLGVVVTTTHLITP
jgi:hypothetical protein